MKRTGIALLTLGLVIFVLASSQRSGYNSVEGALKSTFSSSERSKKDTWESLRWVGLVMAGVGLVTLVVPGKKT